MAKKNDKKEKKKVMAAKKKAPAKAVKKAAPKKAAKPAPKKAPAKKAPGKAKPIPKKAPPAHKKEAPAPPKKAAAAHKPAPKAAPAKPALKAAAAPKPHPKPVAAKAKKEEAKAPKAPEPVEPTAEELEAADEEEEGAEEVVLTDAEGRRYCRVKDCDQLSTVDGYCRYHYLLFWKKIQVRKKILSEGKLERYIEELTARYPDKFLDMLRKDLKSEKEFLSAIQELEIDESAVDSEFEDESANYIEEVRGMGEAGSSRDDEDF